MLKYKWHHYSSVTAIYIFVLKSNYSVQSGIRNYLSGKREPIMYSLRNIISPIPLDQFMEMNAASPFMARFWFSRSSLRRHTPLWFIGLLVCLPRSPRDPRCICVNTITEPFISYMSIGIIVYHHKHTTHFFVNGIR